MPGPNIKDVQQTVGTGNGANPSLRAFPAFATDPVNGDTIVVFTGMSNSAGTQVGPTDNYGNTYVQIGTTIRQNLGNANAGLMVWAAQNIVGGPGFVVTDRLTANNNHEAVAWCLTDVAPGSYNGDWVEAHGGAVAASTMSVGPSTPAPSANSIMLTAHYNDGTNNVVTLPAGWNTTGANGFTAGMLTNSRVNNGGAVVVVTTGYKISSVAETPVYTGTAPFAWVAFVLSFQPVQSPTIASVTPNSGSTLGGTPVTIAGANFLTGTSVTFGGVAATSVVPALNGLSLTCVAPAHAAGLVNVVVTTSAGNVTSVNGYTYVKPPATIHPAKAIHGYEAIVYLESTGDVFTVGTTAVVSGTGVTVNLCQRIDNTHLVLHLTVDPTATVSVRDIVVTIP